MLRDRPGYHLQAARWLEAHSGERLAEYAAPIAQHHERAGLPAEAARLYELAARRAAEQYKPDVAVDYYRKALELVKDLPQYLDLRLNVQERLGRVLQQQGRLVEALYTFHAMQRLAELDGNLQGEALSLIHISPRPGHKPRMLTRDQLHDALSQFTAQRARFGDAAETVLSVLEERLAALPAEPTAVVVAQPKAEQRKQVTVLFAAIDGYTRLAGATHNTERLRQIDLLWRQLDETIFAHGGIVDKHMGDVVMGIFGVPTARENDPERAVRCAFALRELAGEALAALAGASERADQGTELLMRCLLYTSRCV